MEVSLPFWRMPVGVRAETPWGAVSTRWTLGWLNA